jgi:hypothetical protein
MTDNRFDTITQRASFFIDRRAALTSIAASALLATFSRSTATQARKHGNNKPNKKKSDKCKRQGDQCRPFFVEVCATQPDPQACEELFFGCCSILGQCQPTAFFACLRSPA